jgi:hypothetical protein
VPFGTTEYTITLPSQDTEYWVLVRSAIVGTPNMEDGNWVVKSAKTLAFSNPVHAGIKDLVLADGVDGLRKVVASWDDASGVFDFYRVTWWPTADPASALTTDIPVASSTGSYTISGLTPPGGDWTVQVNAFANNLGVEVSDGNVVTRPIQALPPAPQFLGVSSVIPLEGDAGLTGLTINWLDPITARTDGREGIYNGFFVYYNQGSAPDVNNPAHLLTTITNGAQRTHVHTGLPANTNHFYIVRTFYREPSLVTDIVDPNTNAVSGITQIPNPDSNGILTLGIPASPESQLGFNSLDLTWDRNSSSHSYYQIEYKKVSDTGYTIYAQVGNRDTTSLRMVGLDSYEDYVVRVCAVFDTIVNSNPYILMDGCSSVLSARTEPPKPVGEGILTLTQSPDATSLSGTFQQPGSGLYNEYIVVMTQGATCGSAIINKLNTLDNTYATDPTVVQRITDTSQSTFVISSGITKDVRYCVAVMAIYYNGVNFLKSSVATFREIVTTVLPPSFSGVTDVNPPVGALAFTTLLVDWTAATGNFDKYEVIYGTTDPVWGVNTPIVIADQSTTTATIQSLASKTDYIVRVRACFQGECAGGNVSAQSRTEAVLPDQDKILLVTNTVAWNTSTIKWQGPINRTTATYNKFNIYRHYEPNGSGQICADELKTKVATHRGLFAMPTAFITGAADDTRYLLKTFFVTDLTPLDPLATQFEYEWTETTSTERDKVSGGDYCYMVEAFYDAAGVVATSGNTAVITRPLQVVTIDWLGPPSNALNTTTGLTQADGSDVLEFNNLDFSGDPMTQTAWDELWVFVGARTYASDPEHWLGASITDLQDDNQVVPEPMFKAAKSDNTKFIDQGGGLWTLRVTDAIIPDGYACFIVKAVNFGGKIGNTMARSNNFESLCGTVSNGHVRYVPGKTLTGFSYQSNQTWASGTHSGKSKGYWMSVYEVGTASPAANDTDTSATNPTLRHGFFAANIGDNRNLAITRCNSLNMFGPSDYSGDLPDAAEWGYAMQWSGSDTQIVDKESGVTTAKCNTTGYTSVSPAGLPAYKAGDTQGTECVSAVGFYNGVGNRAEIIKDYYSCTSGTCTWAAGSVLSGGVTFSYTGNGSGVAGAAGDVGSVENYASYMHPSAYMAVDNGANYALHRNATNAPTAFHADIVRHSMEDGNHYITRGGAGAVGATFGAYKMGYHTMDSRLLKTGTGYSKAGFRCVWRRVEN